VPRNNNKAKSSSAKGTIASDDGQLLVSVFLKKCNFNKVHELVF
jgi:hypothetical protein